jgi:hypothetical protein
MLKYLLHHKEERLFRIKVEKIALGAENGI